MNQTQWGPGLITLAAGIVTAFVILLTSRKRVTALEEQRDLLADHERKAQELLEQLRELGQDQHLMASDAFVAERARLEKEAAEALKARDEFAKTIAALPAQPAPAAGAGKPLLNPTVKGALWGGGLVLFFVLLGIVLTQEQKPRDDMGQPPAMGQQQQQPSEEERRMMEEEERQLAHLQDRLKASPNDLQLLGAVAHQLLGRERFDEAGTLTDKALTIDPLHTESRIHAAVLRGIRGDPKGALDELEAIGFAHPDGGEALLFAGSLAIQLQDRQRALAAFERFQKTAPPAEHPPQLGQVIGMLRQRLGQQQQPPPMAQQGGGPQGLTQEQIEAFQKAGQTPEFQEQATKSMEAAEADLAAGKFQDALDKYKTVMPALPQSGRAKAGMAWSLLGLNKQPMADRVWGVAVQTDPAAVEALGDTLQKHGDPKGARAVWTKLAESAPGYAGLDSVRKKLQ